MSKLQKAIVGLLIGAWCYTSYLSFVYLKKQPTEDLYCGTFIGRVEHRGKHSTTEYILQKLDNGYTYEVYSPEVSATKNIGDRVCFRQNYSMVYGVGGTEIVSFFQWIINAMLVLVVVCALLWALWKLAGRI